MTQRVLTRLGLRVSLLTLGLAAALSGGEQGQVTATRAFLGPPSEWAHVAIVLHQSSPMFGSQEFYVSGAGEIVIVTVRRDPAVNVLEKRFKLSQTVERATQLIDKIRQASLLDVALEREDQPSATCDNPPFFLMRNGKGEIRALPLIRGAPSAAYGQILQEVVMLRRLTRHIEPVYEGPYDPTYVPKTFAWAANVLGAAKDVPWTRSATAEEIARTESEYWRKVEVQLQQIAESRANEEKAQKQD